MFHSMIFLNLLFSLISQFIIVSGKIRDYQPSQVHLSLGNNERERVVTWVTDSKTAETLVEYGINGLTKVASGKYIIFRDGGSENRTFYIHKVVLSNLAENTTYEYHCGSNFGWSDLFYFHMPPFGQKWSPHLVVYGDMGAVNAQSLPTLQREVQLGMYDAVLHVGDMAYDMDHDNGRVGDQFMKQIEPIAAYVPYMTAVGNHEEKYNFSHYKLRFSMPGNTLGIYYSFNVGPIHFVVISTEVYYFFRKYGTESIISQYNWLKKDLEEASSPENRTIRPWIITMGHRPMYCSNNDKDDCTLRSDYVRVGKFPFGNFGLENLFYQHGVDVEIWAHEHSYERTWPLYDYKVYNGSSDPYVDPKAPIHVVTGSAGCDEYVDGFISKPENWSAFRSSDYGFTRLKVYNSTHLHFEQVSINKGGQIIDQFWVIKNSHVAYEKMDAYRTSKYDDYYFVNAV